MAIMPKPDHIADLERRQRALEHEIEEALLHCSAEDLMIVDLRQRMLHIRDEIEQLHDATVVRHRRLH